MTTVIIDVLDDCASEEDYRRSSRLIPDFEWDDEGHNAYAWALACAKDTAQDLNLDTSKVFHNDNDGWSTWEFGVEGTAYQFVITILRK